MTFTIELAIAVVAFTLGVLFERENGGKKSNLGGTITIMAVIKNDETQQVRVAMRDSKGYKANLADGASIALAVTPSDQGVVLTQDAADSTLFTVSRDAATEATADTGTLNCELVATVTGPDGNVIGTSSGLPEQFIPTAAVVVSLEEVAAG